MKDTEKVSSGKYYSLTGKSVIDPTISQLDLSMNKILGINNENYVDTLLSKNIFSFKINIFNGKVSEILYTGYLSLKTYHLVISFTLSKRIFSMKS